MGITLTDVLLFGKAQSDDVDNATLVIYRRNILRWSALGGYLDVIVKGVAPLSLPDAITNSLSYVKAFGGTEQRDIPDNYLQRQFIYMMDGSYLIPDVIPESDWHIEMDFQTTSVSTASVINYFGGRYDDAPAGAGIRFGHTSSRKVVLYGFDTNNAYTGSTYTMVNNTRYKYVYNNNSASLSTGGAVVDSTTFTPDDTTTSAVGINAYRNPSGSYSSTSEGIYLYSFKAWNGQGELVANYVPAVQKGTVPVVGFYDTVSKTFKTATAGTFAAGGEAVPTPDAPMDIVSNNGVLKVRHQSGLPLGYTLLEYIESTGTQYIDTETKVSDKTKDATIEFKGNWFSNVSYSPFGAQDSDTRTFCTFLSELYCGNGTARIPYVIPTDNNIHTLKGEWNANSNRLTVYVDNVVQGAGVQSGLFADANMYICTINGGSGVRPFSGYIYSVKLTISGVLVRNFIPAKRNSDSVIGMYDTVSNTFFTNAGTGTFTAGNPVSDPVEIYTDGTVETISVHTKNLWTEDNFFGEGYYSDGVWKSSTSFRAYNIAVKPNTNYTMFQVDTAAWGGYVTFWNGDIYLNQANIGNTGERHMTTPADCNKVTIVTSGAEIRTVQLEQGSTATAYVPYYNGGTATAEMLLKVGDYQDVQEIISGAITRNVGVKVLDGTEDWAASGTYAGSCFAPVANIFDDLPVDGGTAYCTHFDYSSAAQYSIGKFNISTTLAIWKDSTTTPTSLNQWLADQYANGTPVMVIYPLATPTTESVTGQTLQVTDGDNTLEITQASLNNLELEAKYQAAVSLTIQEVQDANLDPNVEVTIN